MADLDYRPLLLRVLHAGNSKSKGLSDSGYGKSR